ncbi:hypothetical protein [Deinococcus yunweiensis]|uniref:hypothetical protein n=1 Tax=Deinococcus yunweiensis TaxID=367282 RepID=UPI00398E5B82
MSDRCVRLGKALRRMVLAGVLLPGVLLTGTAHAHPRPGPPTPPAPEVVGFAQLQRVLTAARAVVVTLRAGPVRAAPGGQRFVTLLSGGQAVARLAVRPDGTLAALPGGPVLPLPLPTTALTPAQTAQLNTRIAALTLSGAVQVTPGDYRVPLLSGGVVVAALRLDRETLKVRPDGPPGPGGGPPPPRGPGGR